MVLARPVLDRMGRVLLQKGEELTQPILDRLEAWGIIHVTVEQPGEKTVGEAVDPLSESQILAAIDDRLEHQFVRYPENNRMQTLRQSARQALLKKNSGSGS